MKQPLLFLTVLLCAGSTPAQPLELAKDGKPNATIVLAEKAPVRVKSAAQSLQTYIEKICGVKLPLTTDGKEVPGITLNVGRTAATRDSDLPGEALNPESYAITVRGDDVYLNGRYPTATAFAVTSFIEDQLGVRWFAPGTDWEYVPAVPRPGNLTVDVRSVVKSPATSPRFWTSNQLGAQWDEWKTRNKIVNAEKSAPWKSFQNNIYRIFPPEKYADEHPEYYPLINGKRVIPAKGDVHAWPCIGNPEVQRITAEFIEDLFAKRPALESFSLGMDDVYTLCQCPLCRAMDARPDDAQNRRYSDRYYKFINIVAARVKKTHPDRYIGLLVYDATRKIPETVPHIEDNVFGYITQETASWYDPAVRKQEEELTLAWRARMKHLSRYNYMGFNTIAPRYFPHSLASALQFDKQNGLEGMYTEIYSFLPHTAPMIWSFAKMQWDPTLNIDALLNDFTSKMFGDGSADMQRYFDLLERSWAQDKPGFTRKVFRDIIQQALVLRPSDVREGFAILDTALQKARLPQEKKRIEIVRAALQYYSYMPLEYDIVSRLATQPLISAADAQKGLELTAEMGRVVKERQEFWPQAAARQDLLGTTINGFSKGRVSLPDMAVIEGPVVPAVLRLAHWYEQNQPEGAGLALQSITESFPPGNIRTVLDSWDWVQKTRPTSLIKNGDFESRVANTASVQNDWSTDNIPNGWASWRRMQYAQFHPATGRGESRGMRVSVAQERNDSGMLLQNLNNLTPGATYLAVAWTKVTPGNDPEQVTLSLRLRNKNNWYPTGKGPISVKTVALSTDEWQPMLVTFTLPDDADGLQMQLSTRSSEAIFDDAALYKIPDGGE